MGIFFTSDQHFGHYNIIKYCNRPFHSLEEMDETIIERFNQRVTNRDEVYHLGDFAWCDAPYYFSRLNGRAHHLIIGNHDRKHLKKDFDLFNSVQDVKVVRHEHRSVFCSHYAHARWPASHHGRIHAFGHSHAQFKGIGKSFDVGVDNFNFYPVSFEGLFEITNYFTVVDKEEHHD
jgi:calcineurin-like phosphoesterase family protein